jgi:hypothetical protein
MTTQKAKDDTRRLMDRVDELVERPRNQAKLAHWRRYRDRVPSCEDAEGPMFTMDIGIPTWARILGFDIREFFSNTATHIRYQLEMAIWQQENLCDDTAIGRHVGVSLGNALEASMVGQEVGYPPAADPVAFHIRPVVENDADLDRLQMPDFYTSGEMPKVHRMYAEARDLLQQLGGDGWQVGFPGGYNRGVLGLAQTMRGPHENIIFDTIDRPQFAHRIFRFVTDFHCHFHRERAKFLGQPIGPIGIGNDEVTVPLVSPPLYREFLLPYELEISAFHGGLSVWHSCGTTTPLLPLIATIPNVKQFYTGPWTDVDAVMETFCDKMPIMIAVNTVDDILAATPEQMEVKVRSLADRCHGAALQIRGGSMNAISDLEGDLARMRLWTQVALKALRD